MDTTDSTSIDGTKIFVCGSSNTKKLASDLADLGLNIVDLTIPGWTPTQRNIDALRDSIDAHNPGKGSIVIFDLIANVAFGFEQINGTVALPIKHGGRYHMQGRVTTCSKDSLNGILTRLVPLLNLPFNLKICTPPLPRYLHNPCCDDGSHCEGITEPEYAEELLNETIGIRKTMRDFLHTHVSNVWVPDVVSDLASDGTGGLSKAGMLGTLFSRDGVHLNTDGAKKLATIVHTLIVEKTAASLVSGGGSSKEYFWRGFVSPVGSSRPKNTGCFHKNSAGGGKWRGTASGTGSAGRGGRSYPPPPTGRRRY